jgi:hypothetical protein
MHDRNYVMRTIVGIFAAGLVAAGGGCAGAGAPDDPARGELTFNLVAQSQLGNVYRLRDARITVTGNGQSKTFNTEDDPSRTSLSSDVRIGDYTAAIDPGWRLERVVGSVIVAEPSAELVSPNPTGFSVHAHERTDVPLRFQVDEEVVDMTQGYDIVLETEEVLRHGLVVTNNHGEVGLFATGADGDVAPQRTLADGGEPMVPFGVALAGDELIVADWGHNAIKFFAFDARSGAGPRRQIRGAATGLSAPASLAVAGNELFVVQQGTGTVEVFRLDAQGNVAPTRILNVPEAWQIASDGVDLYVTTNRDMILVYAQNATGSTAPSRTIRGPLTGILRASGIAVHDGEIFLADSGAGQIRVFVAAASGDVTPRRVINQPEQGTIEQVAVFGGEVYAADGSNNAVRVYPAGAQLARVPRRVISGPHTGFFFPFGLAAF